VLIKKPWLLSIVQFSIQIGEYVSETYIRPLLALLNAKVSVK
jgi:hypothetical protein